AGEMRAKRRRRLERCDARVGRARLVQIVTFACVAIASCAAMHDFAESSALSGPQAIGWPTRTAAQKREISCSVADAPSVPGEAAGLVAFAAPPPAWAGLVSDDSIAAAPAAPVTSTDVAAPGLPSSNSSASTSLYMISVAFVP